MLFPLARFLCAFFVAFVLAGNATTAAEPEYIIGFPEDNMANDWRAAQMREIEEELAKHPNVKFLMADAGGSISQNILDIEKMISQGAQLLFLAPRNPEAISLVVSRLRKKGVRIVLLTRKLKSENYDTFISPDDFKIAYEAAGYLAEKMGGTGKILELQGIPTTTTSIQRKNGFIAGLANYPDVKIISKVANYSRKEAIRVIETSLDEGLKFDAIYAHNDAMATGARIVFKKRGMDPAKIFTVGIDFLPETKLAIIAGEQSASFTYPTCGKAGVAAALKILRGEKVPRFISVPFQLVTHDNVDKAQTVY